MKPRGINRVIIAVRDIERAKALYSDLLGATFHDANWTGEPFGINVAISWDAGIELCAPMPGRQKDSAMSPFLEEHGEGIVNVVFGVDDAEEARNRADRVGVPAVIPINYTQEEIDRHLGGLFKTYKEYFLDSAQKCGFSVTLGQIDPK